jgi:DNA-directed RNA polymerase specialized sigma24 family protein
MSDPFVPKDGFRPLSRGEVEAIIGRLDLKPRATIIRTADHLAGDYAGEGHDLLHEAITRALKSRSCREGITGEQFIAGIMRSIASTARRSRERRAEDPVSIPVEVLAEQMALGGYTVQSADEIIETERVRRICADVLDRLSGASATQANLIDGIGLGLRGQALADHLAISLEDLATVRRALKRHAQRLWLQFEPSISPPDETGPP